MEVEKINFKGVQPETEQTFQGKKSVQSDIQESHDEEKRNAAKLMTGGVLLAGTIAAGIFCHKAGVFQKLGKMIKPPYVDKNAQKFLKTVEEMKRPRSFSEVEEEVRKSFEKKTEEDIRRIKDNLQPHVEKLKNILKNKSFIIKKKK